MDDEGVITSSQKMMAPSGIIEEGSQPFNG
jgi:hypothetical protein